eukprot:825129-Pyramimonas_sp.AAC.1
MSGVLTASLPLLAQEDPYHERVLTNSPGKWPAGGAGDGADDVAVLRPRVAHHVHASQPVPGGRESASTPGVKSPLGEVNSPAREVNSPVRESASTP